MDAAIKALEQEIKSLDYRFKGAPERIEAVRKRLADDEASYELYKSRLVELNAALSVLRGAA